MEQEAKAHEWGTHTLATHGMPPCGSSSPVDCHGSAPQVFLGCHDPDEKEVLGSRALLALVLSWVLVPEQGAPGVSGQQQQPPARLQPAPFEVGLAPLSRFLQLGGSGQDEPGSQDEAQD